MINYTLIFFLSSYVAVIHTSPLISKQSGIVFHRHLISPSHQPPVYLELFRFAMFNCLTQRDCPCLPRFYPSLPSLQPCSPQTSVVMLFIDKRWLKINEIHTYIQIQRNTGSKLRTSDTEMEQGICQSQKFHKSITWLKSFHHPFSCAVLWLLKSSYFWNTMLIYLRSAMEKCSVTPSTIWLLNCIECYKVCMGYVNRRSFVNFHT